jgi:predicted RNA-binding Zn-ribbon protein involved in translation (DUF1610 family)
MELKRYKYHYNWNTFNLIVDCDKCGNNIVLQDLKGSPTCSDCGNVNKTGWDEVINRVDILGMKKGNSTQKTLLGSINARASLNPAKHINCYHCNQILQLPEQGSLDNYHCNHCNTPVEFYEDANQDELVFYKAGLHNQEPAQAVQMIAVRCVSCGAPLEVDPTKNNFTCKFCSTENILPPSLRYKVVLADTFVAIRNSKYLKLMAFEHNGQIVKQALRENGRESFENEELNKILLTNKNDAGVYNQITQEFKHLPPDLVLNELFNTSTNPSLVTQVGTRLQKTKAELDARLKVITPEKKQNTTTKSNSQPPPKKPAFYKNPLFIVLVITIVVTLAIVLPNL